MDTDILKAAAPFVLSFIAMLWFAAATFVLSENDY